MVKSYPARIIPRSANMTALAMLGKVPPATRVERNLTSLLTVGLAQLSFHPVFVFILRPCGNSHDGHPSSYPRKLTAFWSKFSLPWS